MEEEIHVEPGESLEIVADAAETHDTLAEDAAPAVEAETTPTEVTEAPVEVTEEAVVAPPPADAPAS